MNSGSLIQVKMPEFLKEGRDISMHTKIKFFIMDVDGTLTDGKIYMGKDG